MTIELNPEIRFIKLRHGEDIIAFLVDETDTHIRVKRPLSVRIQNDFSCGRQLLEVHEWFPPLLTATDEANINKTDLLIMTPVREAFKIQFSTLINSFYEERIECTEPKERVIKKVGSKKGNVLPFFGRDNSKKPN